MEQKEIVGMLERTGALLTGHFKLRSGLHSNRFFQAALVFQWPDIATRICAELAKGFAGAKVETVLSPALGGMLVGYELGRALGVKNLFAEKEGDNLVLRRGFVLRPGEKVVVAEDVITRGGRVQQTIDLARGFGAEVVGVAVVVDRSGGAASFDVPVHSLTKLELETFDPATCPLCARNLPLDTPGSK